MADIVVVKPETTGGQVDRVTKGDRATPSTAFGVTQAPNNLINRAFANVSVDHGPN